MKIIKITFLLSCLFLFFGCSEDKGNYDYIDLNDVEISGLKSVYYPYVLDTLRLEPELTYSLNNEANVSYEWKLGQDQVIGTEKNLEFVIPSDIEGNASVLFTVTDNETGLTKQANVTLLSRQLYANGWLILSEKDGKSALTLIRRDWLEEKEGEQIYEYSEFYDVYATNMKEELGSQPLQIQEHWRSGDNRNPGHVMLVQKGGQACVDLFGGTLTKSLNTDKEFIALPANYNPKEIMYGEEFSYILNQDGKLFSRKNFSKESYYSGYFSDYPVNFEEDGKSTELNVENFVPNFNYRDCGFVMAYEKVNKRFLLISDFVGFSEDNSGRITTLEYNDYPSLNFIPLHDTGNNDYFYCSGYGVRAWGSTGFYNIFKTAEGKFIEQQLELKFDKYGSGAVLITPIKVREIPSEFINDNSVVDVPDGGGGYGSTNVYISCGNKLNYYNRMGGDSIDLIEYYTFDSDIISIDDQHYQNKMICVALANGDVYIMDVSDGALAGRDEKLMHKLNKNIGDIKQVLYKIGGR